MAVTATDLGLDVTRIREDFPLLRYQGQKHAPRHFAYLDSASSSQRPQAVLDAMDSYYSTTHANVHRGVYEIAEEATRLYEEARFKVGNYIGAAKPRSEIVFTKNATEALNLVANGFRRHFLKPGQAILLTGMEHHANLVPWLMLAEESGAEIRHIPIGADYLLDLARLDELVEGCGVVAVTAMSNVLGTVNDLGPIVEAAHAAGALVVCDGSQMAPHRRIDVKQMGVDFLAFTSHKMLGPTGIGVLWARRQLLEEMPPFLGGGEMIKDVRFDGFTTNDVPWKFEAGTPPIAEAVGLGAAVDYLESIGLAAIATHEAELTAQAIEILTDDHGHDLRIFGPEPGWDRRGGVISLAYRDIHPHDLAQVLDAEGVCVRAGHHCAKPLMRHLGVSATARASFYLYNDSQDVHALSAALKKAKEMFG